MIAAERMRGIAHDDLLGASRNVVRAALAGLHKTGKITRRVGHGTIVAALAEGRRAETPVQFLDASPVELLEFRLAMEPGLDHALLDQTAKLRVVVADALQYSFRVAPQRRRGGGR